MNALRFLSRPGTGFWILLALALVPRILLLPIPNTDNDIVFQTWSRIVTVEGFSKIYDRYDPTGSPPRECQYPPGYLYVLWTVGQIYREAFSPGYDPRTITDARLSLLRQMNERHLASRPGELELEARIRTFEMAGRMQLTATDALNLAEETQETQELYGIHNSTTKSYGTRCLMARRLIERGVRFVSLFMAGQPWDTHTHNNQKVKTCCDRTDLPIGGLLTDLKRRGLLDSTLVLWGGEFGRTPAAEIRKENVPFGRDHHPYGFSIWLAGGGIKGGQFYGATDDFGYRAVENRTQTANLHATILHQLGLDHELLTYPHDGRDERLTDLYPAKIIDELIA